MADRKKAVAVIDIGMTNKKVVVFDGNLRVLESASRNFGPVLVEGLETHDLSGIEEWLLDRLAELAGRHRIGAIAVTTHGATLVCVDGEGRPCAPCVYYTHEPGPEFHERFYRLAGTREELQALTGTPAFSAMINPAKGVLFLRERFPESLARTRWLLSYPQYWGLRLTGVFGAEVTYAGCHTYLWDWEKERYSRVAEALGIADRLPSPLRKSWEILGRITPNVAARTGLESDAVVTMGIHDSNASLLPHLAKRGGRDFVLNSTGTWCVLMHPQERYGFAADELGKVVFFNRSALMKPVKTAIFTGGLEYETWSRLIARVSGTAEPPDPGPGAYPRLMSGASVFILPEVVPGSGQFPGSRARAVEGGREFGLPDIESGRAVPSFLRDPAAAMAALNTSLAVQTLVALGRTGLSEGTEVYTEGGFRRNADYNALLASALRPGSTFLTDMAEATSFGAAMTAVAALEGTDLSPLADRFELEYKPVAPMAGIGDFASYRSAWLRLAEGGRSQGRLS